MKFLACWGFCLTSHFWVNKIAFNDGNRQNVVLVLMLAVTGIFSVFKRFSLIHRAQKLKMLEEDVD